MSVIDSRAWRNLPRIGPSLSSNSTRLTFKRMPLTNSVRSRSLRRPPLSGSQTENDLSFGLNSFHPFNGSLSGAPSSARRHAHGAFGANSIAFGVYRDNYFSHLTTIRFPVTADGVD